MEQKQIHLFEAWFDKYVAAFYGSDRFINSNIKLKELHSRRVCDHMRYLTDALGLTENQKRIAHVIALFHDIGRFDQFTRYHTYHDPRSVNHCLLGLDILTKHALLADLPPSEKLLIEKAIEYHGQKELPPALDGDLRLFSMLVRDADKLDIFSIIATQLVEYARNPQVYEFEIELPDEPHYSPKIIQNILAHQRVDYRDLKTLNDMKILQLGWVYDVNFAPTLQRIKASAFLEKILDFLPKTEDIDNVAKTVFDYIDTRLRQGVDKSLDS